MKITHSLLVFPLLGEVVLAFLLWKSSLFDSYLSFALVLILYSLPFGLAFFITFDGAQRGRIALLVVGTFSSLVLAYFPVLLVIGPVDGESLVYLLFAYPVFSWPFALVMSLIGIGADALVRRFSGPTPSKAPAGGMQN